MWAALTEQASPSCVPAVAGDHRLKIRHESGSERAARDQTRRGESVAGGTLIPSWNGLSAAHLGGPYGQAIIAPTNITSEPAVKSGRETAPDSAYPAAEPRRTSSRQLFGMQTRTNCLDSPPEGSSWLVGPAKDYEGRGMRSRGQFIAIAGYTYPAAEPRGSMPNGKESTEMAPRACGARSTPREGIKSVCGPSPCLQRLLSKAAVFINFIFYCAVLARTQ